jgi:hypothetical protein
MLGSKIVQQYKVGSNGTIPSTTDSTQAFATLTFDWSVTNQDVVTNQSTISWSLKATMTSNTAALTYTAKQIYNRWYSSSWQNTSVASIDFGQKNTSSAYAYWVELYLDGEYSAQLAMKKGYVATIKPGESITLASGTKTVTHNNDGTLNVGFKLIAGPGGFNAANGAYVSTGTDGLNANSPSSMRIEASYDLDPISRHGMVYTHDDFGDFTDEDSPMIKYAVPSGVTGYIYMTLDGNVKTQSTHSMTVTGSGTKAYTFTQADLDTIWDMQDEGLRHKSIKFVIKSKSPVDGIDYYESINATLYLINYNPELHIQVYDDNTDVISRLTGNKEILVRNLSKAKCITGAKAVKGSTINTQSVKNAGISKYGATVYFDAVQGNEFEFAVVDNHGNSNKETKVFSVETGKFIKYTKPTANVSVTELTGDGKVAITVYGKYYKGGFGPSVNNKLRISWSLLKHNEPYDSGVFEDVYVDTDSEDNFSYTFQRTGLEYLDVYELTVGVSDVAVPTEVYAEAIIAAVPVFDWGRTDFAFNVPVTIQGASVPSIVEQGTNYTGWTYRKWSDGTAECWYSKKVSAKINTATGNGYGSGAVSGSNVSFPITFIAIPTILVSLTPTGTTTPAYLTPSSTAATTEQTGTYQLNSMSSDSTTRNYIINYEVRGKWK